MPSTFCLPNFLHILFQFLGFNKGNTAVTLLFFLFISELTVMRMSHYVAFLRLISH